MDEREKTCCFTGHRPQKLPWGMNEKDPRCLALKLELAARLEALAELGYRRFICGMALGCDMYFAEAVLALRDRVPDVRLEAAVPFGDQPGRWNAEQRRRYNRLIDAALYKRLHAAPQPLHGGSLVAPAGLLRRPPGRDDADHPLRRAQRRQGHAHRAGRMKKEARPGFLFHSRKYARRAARSGMSTSAPSASSSPGAA